MKTYFKPARSNNYLNIEGNYKKQIYTLILYFNSFETRSTWGHEGDVTLYIGDDWQGRKETSHKIRYYNRTYERYRYESLLNSLINKLKIDDDFKKYLKKRVDKMHDKYNW